MSEIESRLEDLGILLPDEPVPIANYVPGVRTGNLLFLSGLGPADRPDGTTPFRQGGPRPDDRGGLRGGAAYRHQHTGPHEGRAWRSGQGAPSGEAAWHGQQRPGLQSAARRRQRFAQTCWWRYLVKRDATRAPPSEWRRCQTTYPSRSRSSSRSTTSSYASTCMA